MLTKAMEQDRLKLSPYYYYQDTVMFHLLEFAKYTIHPIRHIDKLDLNEMGSRNNFHSNFEIHLVNHPDRVISTLLIQLTSLHTLTWPERDKSMQYNYNFV